MRCTASQVAASRAAAQLWPDLSACCACLPCHLESLPNLSLLNSLKRPHSKGLASNGGSQQSKHPVGAYHPNMKPACVMPSCMVLITAQYESLTHTHATSSQLSEVCCVAGPTTCSTTCARSGRQCCSIDHVTTAWHELREEPPGRHESCSGAELCYYTHWSVKCQQITAAVVHLGLEYHDVGGAAPASYSSHR